MTPEELSLAISACLKDAVAAGEIALAASDIPDEVRVERPKNRDHGDWATNIALQLAKQAGTNPREFAAAPERAAGSPSTACPPSTSPARAS